MREKNGLTHRADQASPAAGKVGRLISRGALHIIVTAIALLWMTPTAGLLISSFRPAQAVAATGWWTAFMSPFQFTLANYQAVLMQNRMGQGFINSIIVAVPSTVIPIAIAAFAAYAFCWMKFPGRNTLFIFTVSLLVVPLQMTLIPVLRLFTDINIVGTFPAIWLAHTAYALPFSIFLLANFFRNIPAELLEAARLDGASDLGIFTRIVLPLSAPAIASLIIFQFLWVWNDLLVALVFLQTPDKVPMTVAITNLVSSYGTQWQLMTSAAFISMALPLVIFFALQRYFVEGITAGAVKG